METRDDYIKFLLTLYEYINFFYALELLRRPHITCYYKKPTNQQPTHRRNISMRTFPWDTQRGKNLGRR